MNQRWTRFAANIRITLVIRLANSPMRYRRGPGARGPVNGLIGRAGRRVHWTNARSDAETTRVPAGRRHRRHERSSHPRNKGRRATRRCTEVVLTTPSTSFWIKGTAVTKLRFSDAADVRPSGERSRPPGHSTGPQWIMSHAVGPIAQTTQ